MIKVGRLAATGDLSGQDEPSEDAPRHILQLGRLLAERICAEGHNAGYQRILLDTLRTMTPALTLYRSLGFEDVPPYIYNPLPEVVYLGKNL